MSRSGPSKLDLTPQDDGLLLTHEEYAEADFQPPWRYERVNGRLVVMTPPGFDHHETVEPFRNHLGAYKLTHSEVIANVFHEAWTVVDDETDRITDISVYLHSNPDPRPFPEKVADMIFEIVSRTARDHRRDHVEKRAEYERIGVQEYVIVDRWRHRVLVLRLADGKFHETELGPDDVYTTPLLPGLAIPLKDIIS